VTPSVATVEPSRPPAEHVISDVLAPEGLMVFADPEPSVSGCMVAAPASLLAQIDKMVEDTL
jgi:hypothetical protein